MDRVQTVGDAEDTICAFERIFKRSLVSDVGLDDFSPFSGQCCNMITESALYLNHETVHQTVPLAAALSGLRVRARTVKVPSSRRYLATLPPWVPVAPVTTTIFFDDIAVLNQAVISLCNFSVEG